MIIWKSNFNIADASVQLEVAHVRVTSFRNLGLSSMVEIEITDETGNIVAKQYQQSFAKAFDNIEEIYDEILPDFGTDAIISND